MSAVWEEDVGTQPLTGRYWLGRIDLRPIALYRIVMGFFVLYNLIEFAPNLRAWFSDQGVMPLWAFLGEWARPNRFCLLDSFNSPPMTWLYWALSVIAALMMIVGYRTRIASAAVWVLMAGYQERLAPLMDGSDTVMRLMLFWHMFTHSGNVWSVDALIARARGAPLPEKGPALAVRATQVQIGWIYFCSVFYKAQGITWDDGTAVHYGLHLTHVFSRDWVVAIADSRPIVAFITYWTLVMESTFLFLTHAPFWHKPLKALALFFGVCLHGGIFLTINVGHFSYMMPICYLPMLEPEWAQAIVDGVWRVLGPARLEQLRARLSALPMPPAQPTPEWVARYAHRGQLAFGAVFVLVSWYSMPSQYRTAIPSVVEKGIQTASLWSSWDMFAPNPLSTDYHLSMPAEFEDGTTADLYGGPTDGPGDIRGFWFTRWWKYMENVTAGGEVMPRELGRYLCREHNFNLKPGSPRLYTFTLFKENQRIPPIGQPWPPPERQSVWVHRCFDKPAERGGKSGPAVALKKG